MVVDVKNINKKNDHIFFELFSAYTNQVIKGNDNEVPQQ